MKCGFCCLWWDLWVEGEFFEVWVEIVVGGGVEFVGGVGLGFVSGGEVGSDGEVELGGEVWSLLMGGG